MGQAHARKWWLEQRFTPLVSDQDSYEEWIQKGKIDMVTRAKHKVQEILETHEPLPLTASEEQIIADIMKEAREYYRKKGLISDAEWSVYMETLKEAY